MIIHAPFFTTTEGFESMGLLAALSAAKTEEDVKDAYIKALGLKKYNKGLIDIRTDEIWFEAKCPDPSGSLIG